MGARAPARRLHDPPPLARQLAAGVAASCPAVWMRVLGPSVPLHPGYGLDLEGKFGL